MPRPNLIRLHITLVGTSPLLVNNFDEKTKVEIEENYQKRAKVKSQPKSAEAQFLASLYVIPGKKGQYGVPASGLKKCAIAACRYVDGIKMSHTTGAFHVVGDTNGLIQVLGDKPVMDRRTVRVGTFGNKKPATRYRGRFDNWSLEFEVILNSGVLSPEQLINLYDTAGFSIGICEYRPEKGGNLGMFEVKRD